MNMISDYLKTKESLLVIIFFAFFLAIPLFFGPLYTTDDRTGHTIRLAQFSKVLFEGNLIVRWAPDLLGGFGMPAFNYYPPLVSYIGSVFLFFGFNYITATNIVFFLSIILSAITMFFFSKTIFKTKEQVLLCSLAYIFIPYRILDIYTRGAFAECFAFVFFPLILYFITLYLKENKFKYLVYFSLSYCGLILTHLISVLIFTPIMIAYFLYLLLIFYNKNTKKKIFNFLCMFVLGILLSAFYLFPAMLEKNLVKIDDSDGILQYKTEDHLLCPTQLIDPFWKFGYSKIGCNDGLSFQIGAIFSMAIILCLLYWAYNHKKRIFYSKNKIN